MDQMQSAIFPVMESRFLVAVVERALSHGADPDQILDGSLLRTDLLSSPSQPIPSACVYFASTRAAALSGDSYICAELAQNFDWRSEFPAPPFHIEAPSLGDTLGLWLRFVEVVQVSMRYRLTIDASRAVLSGRRFLKAPHPPGQADAWDASSWMKMFADQLGSAWDRDLVTVDVYDPAAIPPNFLPASQVKKSNAWQVRISFPSIWLLERSRVALPPVAPAVQKQPTAVNLEKLFEAFNYSEWRGAQSFARFLGYHPKALQRELAARGTGCGKLVDGARSRLARKWLSDPERSIVQIGRDLGYKNPSAFTRAYNRWYGCAPEDARR